MKNKIAIYVRVSTHHQIDKDSLPLQQKDLINYSEYVIGSKDYEIFEDAGYSAKNTDRPKYQEMMTKVRNGEFSHLLVWKIDRISRNLLDFCDMYEELKKYNCTFVSKNEQFDTSSAMGEAMLKIILVFAELERKLTGERVTSVMLDRASKGLWNGAPVPLGYKWNKEIKFPVPDLEETLTVKYIFNNYKDTESTSAVRNLLNSNGIKTKKNGEWTTKTISDIIRNPFYIGTYRYNYRESAHGKKKKENEWIVLEDNHEGIIDKELWQKCNDIMDVNAQRNNARFRGNVKVHVFAGLLECGECHHSFYSKQDKPNQDGFIPSFYWCSGRYNHLGCNQKTVNENIIGSFTFNYISNLITVYKTLRKPTIAKLESSLLTGLPFKDVVGIENIEDIYNAVCFSPSNKFKKVNDTDSENNNNSFELNNLKKEKNKFERALERLEDLYLFDDEAMSEKDYLIKKNKINSKLSEINSKLSELKKNIIPSDELNFILLADMALLTNRISNMTKNEDINYKNLVIDASRENLKEFANKIIDTIIVKDKKILSIKFKNGLESKFIYNS